MTLGLITPKGNIGGGEANVKPMVSLAGRVLFKANCQEGPIPLTVVGMQNQGT